MTASPSEQSADYVSNEDALRYILERQGFQVIDGDFVRMDGFRTRVAVVPVDPRPMLRAALDARWWDDKRPVAEILNDGSVPTEDPS
jgi:hypothetical protein